MADFKKLQVWRAGHHLSVQVYHLVRTLPRDELYGLRSQMTRAAGSVPANIAEGVGRGGDRELARFLGIALGSATELECHVLRALDLGLVDLSEGRAFLSKVDSTQRMIAALRLKIHRRIRASGDRHRASSHPGPST